MKAPVRTSVGGSGASAANRLADRARTEPRAKARVGLMRHRAVCGEVWAWVQNYPFAGGKARSISRKGAKKDKKICFLSFFAPLREMLPTASDPPAGTAH